MLHTAAFKSRVVLLSMKSGFPVTIHLQNRFAFGVGGEKAYLEKNGLLFLCVLVYLSLLEFLCLTRYGIYSVSALNET